MNKVADATDARRLDLEAVSAIAKREGLTFANITEPTGEPSDSWRMDYVVEGGEILIETSDDGVTDWTIYAELYNHGCFVTAEGARAFASKLVEAASVCDELNALAVQ